MKKSICSFIVAASLGTTLSMLSSCGSPTEIDYYTSEIASVEDGATVTLNSGLRVKLCGLNPQDTYCKEQLEKYIGEEIELMHDSQLEESFVEMDATVHAYAQLTSSGTDIVRHILSSAGERGFYTASVNDSLESYSNIFKKRRLDLDDEQMCSMLRACSMLVFGTDVNSKVQVSDGAGIFCFDASLGNSNNLTMAVAYRASTESMSDRSIDLNLANLRSVTRYSARRIAHQ